MGKKEDVLFHRAVMKQSTLLLLCLHDLAHRAEKVRGSDTLQLSWANWYSSYLHSVKKKNPKQNIIIISPCWDEKNNTWLTSCFQEVCFAVKVSIKIDIRKSVDISKAFPCNLFCKSVCLENVTINQLHRAHGTFNCRDTGWSVEWMFLPGAMFKSDLADFELILYLAIWDRGLLPQ